jgi:hypothetical protein
VGLFDKFKDMKNARNEKRASRNLASLKNPKAIKEDRWGAIEYFETLGDVSVAVPALLQRFEYSLEHGINDTREKEACLEAIKNYGPDAMPLVREHLQSTNRIAWPIKTLKALGEESQVVEILKSALDFNDVAFDQARVDKNYDILCYLVEYQLPNFADKLSHFLSDPDERVRFACVEVMIEQDDSQVPQFLERFLPDASSENTRIRQAVLEAFLKKSWEVKNCSIFPEGQVVGPIFINKQHRLELRS